MYLHVACVGKIQKARDILFENALNLDQIDPIFFKTEITLEIQPVRPTET